MPEMEASGPVRLGLAVDEPSAVLGLETGLDTAGVGVEVGKN